MTIGDNDVTSNSTVYSGSNSGAGSTLIASGTGTFDLPVGHTRLVNLNIGLDTGILYGHTVIKCTSNGDKLRKT